MRESKKSEGGGAFKAPPPGSYRVNGVNVGNCAILQNSNDFIEFVIELNCFKYGHMKMCHMKS